MLTILVLSAWLATGTVAYRYTGYAWEQDRLSGHEFMRICSACTCKHCGGYNPALNESYGDCRCENYEPRHKHPSTFTVAFPGTLVLWPLILLWWGIASAYRKSGMQLTFFAPPPVIRSAAEKKELQMAEQTARIEELEAELAAMDTPEQTRLRSLRPHIREGY